MWNYKILDQKKEIVPTERLSSLDNKPLPDGALVVVEFEVSDGTEEHTYKHTERISEPDTIPQIVKEQVKFYKSKDDASKQIEQVKKVDDYLAKLTDKTHLLELIKSPFTP